jgi:hypothetical protein
MLLFICHVSEDKDDFVRPLAEALRKEYEVWYDEFQLRLGDSLLRTIDEGLRSCDFGIVVLSKAFFAKKDKNWAEAELAGLFALETKSRKIILPIWKDVSADEVKQYSAILVDKYAVSASEGLPKVLEQIRLAVNVSDRQRQLTAVDTATQRVQRFKQSMEDKHRTQQLLASAQGVELILADIEKVWQAIQKILASGIDPSSVVKFQFAKNSFNHMYASTVGGMFLGIRPTNVTSNSVSSTVLEVKIFRREWDRFGEPTSDPLDLHDEEFKPVFRTGDKLFWINMKSSNEYSSDELASHLVNLFIEHVEKDVAARQ